MLGYNTGGKTAMRPRVGSTGRLANIQSVKGVNVSMYQPTLFNEESQDSRQKNCNSCGKSIRVFPSRVKSQTVFFCNRACQNKARTGATNSNWKGGLADRECLICSAKFQVKQKTVRKGGGMYCSNSCRHAGAGQSNRKVWQARRIKKHCQICDKAIFVKPSHVEIEGTYCSTDCMSVGYVERLKGEANPNWRNLPADHHKEWARNWRKAHPERTREWNRNMRARRKSAKGAHSEADILRLLNRQRGDCAGCKNKLRGIYHVDHIFPLAKGGTNYIGNLQLLCPQCNITKKDKFWIQVRRQLASPYLERVKLFEWRNTEIGRLPQLQMMFEMLPDFFKHKVVVSLAYPVGGKSGMFIELDTYQVSSASTQREQRQRAKDLRAMGYRVEVCYGWEAARDVILNYLEGK